MRRSLLPLATLAALGLAACGDSSSGGSQPGFEDAGVVESYADDVVVPTYELLADRAAAVDAAIAALAAEPNDANLAAARAAWVAARVPWEQSEAFLFGPVDFEGYDPALDSWPLAVTDLQLVLGSGDALTQEYVAALPDTQKGFHTIEYLIFGEGGAKPAAALTARELEYLQATTSEFVRVTQALADAWTGGFRDLFVSAGQPGSPYASLANAAEEILVGMAVICDEVANGKIADPYDAHDPDLVESQFSYNSLVDFQDNLRSVRNAYTGGVSEAGTDGEGLDEWVAARDAALDARVKAEIQDAIDAIGAIPPPFRDAISDPSAYDEIEAAQDAVRTLLATIEGELRELVLP